MTGGIGALVAAVVFFLASHAIPAAPGLRGRLVAALGLRPYLIAYSSLSLAAIAWLGIAYAGAPYVELWPQQPWQRWVPFLAMLAACVLLVSGLTTPNPFSIGRGGAGYDPARPGVLRLTRHPVPWALVLWAGAHLAPNGDLASVLLFAPLLALALAGPALLERKRRRALGAAWERLAAPTARPATISLAEIGAARLAGGVLVWLALLLLHPTLIGVSPLPLALL